MSKKTSRQTRSQNHVWLIGQQIDNLHLDIYKQLPTNGEVLRRLFHDLKTRKLNLSESSSNVITEVFNLWQAANIPTILKQHAVAKLQRLYRQHENIKKNRGR